MLINFTNHPSERWSENQKAAAEEYGEIVDMSFPTIDETEDETYIKGLVEEYYQRIMKLSEGKRVVVHLMGGNDVHVCISRTVASQQHSMYIINN